MMFIRSLNIVKSYWLILTIINVLVVSILSLTPLEHLPAVPGGDKIHHLVSYFLLILPCALAKPRYWVLIVFTCILWSGAIELIQPSVNRYGEWLDFAANTLGVCIGIAFATVLNSYPQLGKKSK